MYKSLFINISLIALATCSAGAQAQSSYPSNSVRIIVPQTAGGPSDVLGRLFAQKLSESLGKPVLVENKPGAGGNIGTDLVAKSKPDGLNLLVNISGILAINQTLYKQLPFDAGRDLDGVARVVTSQLVLVAHPSFAPNNIAELVAAARQYHPVASPTVRLGRALPSMWAANCSTPKLASSSITFLTRARYLLCKTYWVARSR